MSKFIEEFYYGNLDPQARSTKENKTVQKQMEVLMQFSHIIRHLPYVSIQSATRFKNNFVFSACSGVRSGMVGAFLDCKSINDKSFLRVCH